MNTFSYSKYNVFHLKSEKKVKLLTTALSRMQEYSYRTRCVRPVRSMGCLFPE